MKEAKRSPYIVTNNTFLVAGQVHKGQQEAIIYDLHGTHVYPVSSSKIMHTAARHYGQTLNSLALIAKQFLGNNVQKLPICLTRSYSGPCVFFPIWSSRTATNIWVNANAVTLFEKTKDGILLTLKSQFEVHLPIQSLAFSSLYARAVLFSNYIEQNYTHY